MKHVQRHEGQGVEHRDAKGGDEEDEDKNYDNGNDRDDQQEEREDMDEGCTEIDEDEEAIEGNGNGEKEPRGDCTATTENYGLMTLEKPKRTVRRESIRLFGRVWSLSYYSDKETIPLGICPRTGMSTQQLSMEKNAIIRPDGESDDDAMGENRVQYDDPELWPPSDPGYCSFPVDGTVHLTHTLKPSLCTKEEYQKYLRIVSGFPATYPALSKIHGTGLFVVKAVRKGA